MSNERQPSYDAVNKAIGKSQTLVETLHDFTAKVIDHFGRAPDKAIANALKGVSKALGPIGALASVGLGYAHDGNRGAASSAAGALAGMAVVAGIGAAVTLGGPALLAMGVSAGVVGGIAAGSAIVGGIASWFASDFIEDLAKEHLTPPAANPPGSNHPDANKGSSGSSNGSSGDNKGDGGGHSPPGPNAPGTGNNNDNDSDRPSQNSGGGVSGSSGNGNSGNSGYDGGGWGGDPYSGKTDGYNGGGYGGDPYSNPAPDDRPDPEPTPNTNHNGGGWGGDPYAGDPGPGTFDPGPGYNDTDAIAPVFLDLDGDGIDIIQLKESMTFFDYNGDGVVGRTAWVGEGNGMLVLDLDERGYFSPDGKIDHADEFIFSKWARGARSDMEALRTAFDTNRDGMLSAADANFASFRIWVDANANAVSDPGELKTLQQLGISYIPLSHDGKRKWFADGSRINGTNKTITSSGKSITVADVVFAIGSQNATMTVTENSVKIKLGDGAVYNMYSGTGDRTLAESLGKKGYAGAVLRQKDGTRLTAIYGTSKALSTLYHQTAAGKLLEFETWTAGQHIKMSFSAKQKLTNLQYFGSAKDDTYKGGDEATELQGKGGDDRLYGGDGNDTLNGGDDSDKLYGQSGSDKLFGDKGSDELSGGAGEDSLIGGDDRDSLHGGDGRDTLEGGIGEDILAGDGDADRLSGESGDDLLSGGTGDDWLDGGEEDDDLLGEDGNDTLIGGAAIDYLYGGAGDDSLNGGEDGDVLFGDEGHDALEGGNGRDELNGGSGRDTLEGGDDIDRLDGGADNDLLSGGAGRDTLLGGSGDDVLQGDDANDSLDGGERHDTLVGGEGDDTLRGRTGNDELNGGAGDDDVDGGDGNDIVYGSTGNDALLGADGDDRLYGEIGNDHLDGGSGNDTLHDEQGNNTLQGGDGNDLLVSGDGRDYLAGGEGSDTLRAGLGDDQLIGGGGSDTLEGGGGADKLWGGAGGDLLLGGDGADVVDGEEGDDRLVGGDGDDKLAGGAGNDTLDGGAGHDQLFGGEGNDILIGGPAVDFIDGGGGTDTIVLSGRRVDYEIKFNAAIGRYSIVDLRSGSPDGTDLASIERFRFADGEVLASLLDYIVGTDLETAWNIENSDTTRTTIGWRASAENPTKLEAYITHYSLSGDRQSETIFKPDGSRISTGWDVEGTQAWASFNQTFDGQARLTREAYEFDNLTRKVTEWDHDALGPWWQRETDYDSGGRALKQVEFDHAKKKSFERVWDYTVAVTWSRHTSQFDSGGRAYWQEWLYDNGTRGTLEKDLAEAQEWTEHEQLYEGTTLLMNRYKYDDAHIAKYGASIITDRWDNGSTNWKEYRLLQDKLERNIWERYIYDNNAQTITQWDHTGSKWLSLETRYNPSGIVVWQKESYRKQAYILREWDDTGANWTSREFHYNEDGLQTWQEYRYDDASRQVWAWNYDGADWSSYWQEFDAKGSLAKQRYVYDNGSYTNWEWSWDYSVGQPINRYINIYKYNSDGKLFYEYMMEFSIYEYVWETDYLDADWNTKYTVQKHGKLIEEDVRYDDKTRRKTLWDRDDADPWEKLVTRWDSKSRKDFETANWDDGTIHKWDWDPADDYTWQRKETHTRAGEKIFEEILYDTDVRIRKKYDVFNEQEWKDYYQEWNAGGTLVREWYTHDTLGVVVVVGTYNGLTADEKRLFSKGIVGGELTNGDPADDAVTTISTSDDEMLEGTTHHDAFVFAKHSGHDVIANFQTGAGFGDVLMFSQSSFKSWSSVLKSAKQSDADVIITVDKDNSLVLKNVMLSSLSADDFRFVA